MDIVGIGIDATEIARVAHLMARYGSRFTGRVFTTGEIAYCERRRTAAASYAARFAAKEAALKALGTGLSGGIAWRDVEVVRLSGPPQLLFHRRAAEHFARIGATKSVLTLTHARELALAQVILLGGS